MVCFGHARGNYQVSAASAAAARLPFLRLDLIAAVRGRCAPCPFCYLRACIWNFACEGLEGWDSFFCSIDFVSGFEGFASNLTRSSRGGTCSLLMIRWNAAPTRPRGGLNALSLCCQLVFPSFLLSGIPSHLSEKRRRVVFIHSAPRRAFASINFPQLCVLLSTRSNRINGEPD